MPKDSRFDTYEFQAQAGIKPKRDDMPFKISTEDAYKFVVVERLNAILEKLRQAGRYNLPERLGEDEVRMIAIEIGKRFTPFVIMLPTSLLEKNAKRKNTNNNDQVLGLFNPEDEDGTQHLVYEIYQFFKAFMYTKDDLNAFKSPTARHELGIPSSMIPVIKNFSVPSVKSIGSRRKDDDDSKKVILVFLDPIRIFHEMLINKANPREPFKVKVDEIRKIKDGNFVYDVTRKVQKRGTSKSDFDKEITKFLRGGIS